MTAASHCVVLVVRLVEAVVMGSSILMVTDCMSLLVHVVSSVEFLNAIRHVNLMVVCSSSHCKQII